MPLFGCAFSGPEQKVGNPARRQEARPGPAAHQAAARAKPSPPAGAPVQLPDSALDPSGGAGATTGKPAQTFLGASKRSGYGKGTVRDRPRTPFPGWQEGMNVVPKLNEGRQTFLPYQRASHRRSKEGWWRALGGDSVITERREGGKSGTPRSRWRDMGEAWIPHRRPTSKGTEGHNACFGQRWEWRSMPGKRMSFKT